MKAEKVNAVGSQGKASEYYDSNSEEEAKYLDCELVGFRTKGQGPNQDFWNSRKGNQGRNYYGDRFRVRSKECDGDWRRKDDYKEKGDMYVPPDNRNTKSKMEAILSKLVKGQGKSRNLP